MLSIDRERDKIIRRDELIHRLYLLIICLASIIIVLAIMIFSMTRAASASAVCLTKAEARVLWPKQHIYWYGKDHCWSNRRGGPPRGIKIDLIKNNHAESLPALPPISAGKADRANAPQPSTVRPFIIYPPLNMAGSVPSEMLSAYAATTWPLIIDIDEDPELGVTKDGCCWPQLHTLVGDRSKPLEKK